jgi:hypothetical protein
MIARDKFKAKIGSYKGLSHMMEVLQITSYKETDNSTVETRRPQGQECMTEPEAQTKTGTQGLPVQAGCAGGYGQNFSSGTVASTDESPQGSN